MAHRKLLVTEASEKERESKRTQNIIFLDLYYTLHDISHDNSESKIQQTHMDTIRADPKTRQAIESQMLEDKEVTSMLELSSDAIYCLCRLCEDHAAKIVICTDWPQGTRNDLQQLKALLSIRNFDEYIIDGIKQVNAIDVERWLVEHTARVNSYVILSYEFTSLGLREHFGERYINCRTLLSKDSIYNEANRILGKPLEFAQSSAKLTLDAIGKNSPFVTKVEFNLQNMSELKVGYGWDTQRLLNYLFSSMEKSQYITDLTIRDMYADERHERMTEEALTRIANLIVKSPMKLKYLDISHNYLTHFDRLLSVLDGRKVHIPHICFNANPVHYSKQQSIARWMETYPAPIQIDLDLSGSGWGRFPLDACFVDAVALNKNIQLDINGSTFQSLQTPLNNELQDQLIKSGRIKFSIEARGEKESCRIQ